MRYAEIITAGLLMVTALPAAAQSFSGSAEAETDERRRGLSWSEGKAAIAASATVGLPAGFDIGARVTTLRDSPRAGGADAVIDGTLGDSADLGGGVRGEAFEVAHLFTGARGGMNYIEGGAGLSYQLGPAQIGADLRYAPSQSAIGGDNLYLHAGAQSGIPGTPWTVLAGIGRSTGATDDAARAARLRPGGDYTDWRLGVEHVTGPVTLGLDYVGTDVSERAASAFALADARHSGDRIVGRVRFSF